MKRTHAAGARAATALADAPRSSGAARASCGSAELSLTGRGFRARPSRRSEQRMRKGPDGDRAFPSTLKQGDLTSYGSA